MNRKFLLLDIAVTEKQYHIKPLFKKVLKVHVNLLIGKELHVFYLNIIVKKFFSFTCTKNHIINIQIYFSMRVATQIALSKAFCKIAWRTRSYAVVVIWIWALSVYIKQGEIHLGKRKQHKRKKRISDFASVVYDP